MSRGASILRDERGTTLVVMLILLLGFLTLAVGGLVSSTSDLKVSRNYTSGAQALLCAESGLLHAQKVIDSSGVIRFNVDVTPNWATLWGTSAVPMPGAGDCAYTVTASDDSIDPIEYMVLTSVGAGPNGARRSVRARLQLGNAFTPGAIYIPNPNVGGNFNGNSFLVDGNDRNLDGSPGPGGAVPGMATSTDQAAQNVLDSLSGTQQDNVIGLGGEGSVLQAAGPSSTEITEEIIPNLLAQAGVFQNPTLHGSDVFGTTDAPQITYFDSSVTLNGNVSGAGVLIVDGGLTVSGNMDFTGLIIVRGTTEITTVTGSSGILGGIWTTELTLAVGGSASVTYSTEALNLVNSLGSGNVIPQRVKAVAWSQL